MSLRLLSDSEIAWSRINPQAWCNLCRSVSVAGRVELAKLRAAISSLQGRLPELGACLIREARGIKFVRSTDAIKIRCLNVETREDIVRAIEQELAEPVGSEGTPLMRVTLFRESGAEQTTLLLTCHHAIIDRNSVMNLLDTFVEELTGVSEPQPPSFPPRSQVDEGPHLGWPRYLQKQARLRLRSSAKIAARHRLDQAGETRIAIRRYSPDTISALMDGARRRGVTLTGLLVAASMKSYAALSQGDRPVAYSVAADLARGERFASVGSRVGLLQDTLDGVVGKQTAELAADVVERIQDALARGEDRLSARFFAKVAPILGWLAGRRPFRLGGLTVTNLGRLDLPSPAKPFGIVETFGVVTNTRIFYDVAVHANTVADRLVISLTTSVLTDAAFRQFSDDLDRHLLQSVGLDVSVGESKSRSPLQAHAPAPIPEDPSVAARVAGGHA
ncbi:MAG: condensation domain-containing protein [Pseudomonadota bacterium]